MINYFEVLGIPESTTDDREVKRAYRMMAKLHHSDRGGNDLVMGRINYAYEVLRNQRVDDPTWKDSACSETCALPDTDRDLLVVRVPGMEGHLEVGPQIVVEATTGEPPRVGLDLRTTRRSHPRHHRLRPSRRRIKFLSQQQSSKGFSEPSSVPAIADWERASCCAWCRSTLPGYQ